MDRHLSGEPPVLQYCRLKTYLNCDKWSGSMQYSYLKITFFLYITCYRIINLQILLCYLSTMSKNASWIIECPRKETVLYFKLMAKQIEAELLTRVISVCLWMAASEGCMPPTLSVYFGYISISLVWINFCVWDINVIVHTKVCLILCSNAALSRLLRLVPWATGRESLPL